jgi:hypothetical protein
MADPKLLQFLHLLFDKRLKDRIPVLIRKGDGAVVRKDPGLR